MQLFASLTSPTGIECTGAHCILLQEKYNPDKRLPLHKTLALCWFNNPWLWLGVSLCYCSPFSWISLLWWLRTFYLVTVPSDEARLPPWAQTLQVPSREAAYMEEIVQAIWEASHSSVIPDCRICWGGMSISLLVVQPSSLWGTFVVMTVGVIAFYVMQVLALYLATQLLGENLGLFDASVSLNVGEVSPRKNKND